MKRFIIILAIALASALNLGAQQMQEFPLDKEVKKGVLSNGMTYYIRHNALPEGRAEFYLATHVGAIQEDPDQDGLAHFLEHMCFNGTKNYPGKALLDYLQSIGAEFGRNINASTGFEQTVYMLNNIPLKRSGVIDSCLLVMHDYSHFVLNEPEEIDAERGVILEERRTRRTADWRLFEQARPYYFGSESKFAGCTLIGSEENLKTFKPESIVRFYQEWCRPDLQALIVVGDIDVDDIEARIKTIFADIPAVENPRQKEIHKAIDNSEPRIGILTDPEATNFSILYLVNSEAFPREMKNTPNYYVQDILISIISSAINERISDITSKPGAPFINAGFGYGSLCEATDALQAQVLFKDGEAVTAFTALMTELEKVRRYGITEAEFKRAKDNISAAYKKAADGASTRQNASLVQPLIDNFMDNTPVLDPADEYQVVSMLLSQIPLQAINQSIPALFTEENQVVVYEGPEKEGIMHPTVEALASVLKDVRLAEIAAPEGETLDTELLNSKKLKGSKVKKAAAAGVYGSTEWTLKNGVRVIVLPTEYKKDQVMMRLIKMGGESLIEDADLYSFEDNIWGMTRSEAGVGKFNAAQLGKVLSGNTASASITIGTINGSIHASSSPDDIETALQLMYLHFTSPRFDPEAYNAGIERLEAILPNVANDPSFALQKAIPEVVFGGNPRRLTISEDVIAKASLATQERVYKSIFNGAKGATLIVVGNVQLSEIAPLINKYIGSIPAGKKESQWIDRKVDIVKGEVIHHFAVPMSTPKSTVLQVVTADVPYSIKKEAALDVASNILDIIYTKTLREEEGGTYGASAAMQISRLPRPQVLIQVMFDTNVEQTSSLEALAVKGLKSLTGDGITDENFSQAKSILLKNIPERRIQNSYWMNLLFNAVVYGDSDFDTAYEAALQALTPDDVREVMSEILSQNNFIEIEMSAE